MTLAETNLENIQHVFLYHVRECQTCKGYDHSARALTMLCFNGVQLLYSLTAAEDTWIKQAYKIKVDGSPESLRSRAKREVINERL